MADPHFMLEAAMEHFQRALQHASPSRPLRLVIRKHNPGGMSGHGTTEVQSIAVGFDWEAGRVVITPAKPMTELTPEDVEAITKSVRAGGSWHAYKSQEKLRERALKAEARVAELEMQAEAAADQLRAAVLAERERCAKVCERVSTEAMQKWVVQYTSHDQGCSHGASECADAIRKGTP